MATMRLRTEVVELSDLNEKMRGIEGGTARVVASLMGWPLWGWPSSVVPDPRPAPQGSDPGRGVCQDNEPSMGTGKRSSALGKFAERSPRHGICLATV